MKNPRTTKKVKGRQNVLVQSKHKIDVRKEGLLCEDGIMEPCRMALLNYKSKVQSKHKIDVRKEGLPCVHGKLWSHHEWLS